MKRETLILTLVLLLALAGCTQLTDDGPEQTEDVSNTKPTMAIDAVHLSNTRLRPGDNITLAITVQNKNSQPARGTVRLANIAPLTVAERINSDTYAREDFIDQAVNRLFESIFGAEDTPISQIDRRKCKTGLLRPKTDTGFPGESSTCEWILTCREGTECERISRDYGEPFDVPITVDLNYSTILAPDSGAVSVEFKPFREISSGEISKQTYEVKNGDIKLKATYESPRSLDTESFQIDYKLTDVGKGSSSELRSPVRLIYNGSFVDQEMISPRSLDNCDTMVIPEGSSSTQTECGFALERTPVSGVIHNLIVSGGYRYQKKREVQLQIYPTSG